MTDESMTEGQPTTETQPEQSAATGEALSFTPSALAARIERAQRKALTDFLGELGFEKPEDLKAKLTAAVKREQSELGETERLKLEIETERQKSATALEAAQKAEARRVEAVRNAAIHAAAVNANAKVPDDVLMWASGQDLSALVDEDGKADSKAIAKLIDTLKKERAHWFGNGGSGTPGSPSNAGGTPTEPDKKAKQNASRNMVNMVRNRF